MSKYQRKIRLRLSAKNNNCFWCGKETHEAPKHNGIGTRYQHPDMSTLDHLFPRYHALRTIDLRRHAKFVLSCYACNVERAKLQHTLSVNKQTILQKGTKPSFCIL